MKETEPHYLEAELYERIRTDPSLFDFLQSGSLDGIWYWDVQNPEHEWMSKRFWEVLGYAPETMPHCPDAWQDIINPDDLKTALENFHRHCADPDHPYDQHVRYRHKDGSTVTVRCRGIAIRDDEGRAVRMLGAHTDITALVQAQEKAAARDEAEAANISKTAFLATMSHEIRTPLNSLLAITEALSASELTPEQTEMVTDITVAGTQLFGLLTDILDMAKIEAGAVSMERQDFRPDMIVHDVVAMFSEIAEERSIGLSAKLGRGADLMAIGSEKRIRQVIINLVSNALKFTEEGEVMIAASLSPMDDNGHGTLTMQVIDTGPGVPERMKDAIFGRFQQGDNVHENTLNGAGLGLSIARTLCTLHGGNLYVEDTRGGGATFIATFAVEISRRTEPAPTMPSAIERLRALPRQLHLLVAEDVLLNRKSLRHLLKSSPVTMTFVVNGRQALDQLTTEKFDAALIDIRMPVMNGLELVRAYRQHERDRGLARMPIIACSANVLRQQIVEYGDAGFDGFLAKPFSLDDLVDKLTEIALEPEHHTTSGSFPQG